MKVCIDPRHETPCTANNCTACKDECDPKYFVDEESVCPDCFGNLGVFCPCIIGYSKPIIKLDN